MVMENIKNGFPAKDSQVLKFYYRNYRGEISYRRVKPTGQYYGSNKYHPEEQWFLIAWDYDKKAERHFAYNDFIIIDPGVLKKTRPMILSTLEKALLLGFITFLIMLGISTVYFDAKEEERCKPIHIKGDQWQVPHGCKLPPGFAVEDPTEWKKR